MIKCKKKLTPTWRKLKIWTNWSYLEIFKTLYFEKLWISKLLWRKTWKLRKCTYQICKNQKWLFQTSKILPRFNAKFCLWKNSGSSMKFLPPKTLLFSSLKLNLRGPKTRKMTMVKFANWKSRWIPFKSKTCTSEKITSAKKGWWRRKFENLMSFKRKPMTKNFRKKI